MEGIQFLYLVKQLYKQLVGKFLFLCLLLPFASAGQDAAYRYSYQAMGTEWLFIIQGGHDTGKAADAAYTEVKRIEKIFSSYDSTSEVSILNATEEWMEVSAELVEVIHYAEEMRGNSGGAFDVRIGSTTRLWKNSMADGQVPPPANIDVIKNEKLKLEINENLVRTRRYTQVDFGGIAKGYAVDKAYEVLLSHGYDTILVDGGGDIRMGHSPDGKGWKIQQHYDEGRLLRLENTAIATSGPDYNSMIVGTVEYSHIINPVSHEALTHNRGVTVISETCMIADALATALSVSSVHDRLHQHYDFQVSVNEKGSWVVKEF